MSSRRLVAVWAALMVITIASIDAGLSGGVPADFAVVGVLVACLAKVALIGLEFIGLTSAPPIAIVIFLLWATGICVVLGGFFLRPDLMPVRGFLFF